MMGPIVVAAAASGAMTQQDWLGVITSLAVAVAVLGLLGLSALGLLYQLYRMALR